MRRATLASLRAHKARVALTALSVVLGISFVAGSFILTDTLRATFDELFSEAFAGLDVTVRSETAFAEQANSGDGNREPVPESLVAVVRGVEGVKSADGSIQGYAQFVNKEGKAVGGMGPPTLGFNWNDNDDSNADASAVTIREGRPPRAAGEVAVDARTAKSNDFRIGDRVTVLLAGPPEEFAIVGIVGFGEADNLAGATIALFDTPTAHRVFSREGQFDAIGVIGDGSLSDTELRDRVAAVLPDGIEAVTGAQTEDEAADAVKRGFAFFSTALLAFAGISLFVGAFIIHNTFSILIAQRTRELALLRALGASQRQVITSVVAESAIVGLGASIVGLVAGLAMAIGLQALLSGFGIDLPSTTTQFLPRTVIVSIVLGVGVTVVSALGPARRAARIAPVAALAEGEHATDEPRSRLRPALGGVTVLLAVGLVAAGTIGGGFPLVALGGLLLFLGVAIVAPVIAVPIVRALAFPAKRLGTASQLGRENAIRSPRRTAATAAALMIGLGMVTFSAVFAASIKASSSQLIDDAFRADLFLTSQSFGGFSTAVAEEMAADPASGNLTTLRFGQFQIDGEVGGLTATDPIVQELLTIEVVEGDLAALGRGHIAINETVAERKKLAVGDTVEVEFARTGTQQLQVGAIYEQAQLVGPYLISRELYEANYSDVLDGVVLVDAAAKSSIDELRAAANRIAERNPNLVVQDQAEFKESQSAQVNQLLGLVTVLLTLALIIAMLGIVNTLALSVLERTREIGLLRAVGMARRQVRSMIRIEAVLVSVLGGVLGIVVGVVLAAIVVYSLADQGFSALAIPSGQLVTFLLVAAIAGLGASLLPARRAARLNVLDAIHVG